MVGFNYKIDCYNVMFDFIFIYLSVCWILLRKDVYWYIVKYINKVFILKIGL